MTLKDKLPDRLKCSPLLTMESDSDIETIAESIVNLSDSDGGLLSLTCYEGFRHAATRETRTSIVTTLLLVLEEVEKEDAYGK